MPVEQVTPQQSGAGVVQAPQQTPGAVVGRESPSSQPTAREDGKYVFRGKEYNADLDAEGKVTRLYTQESSFYRVNAKNDANDVIESYTPEELFFDSSGQITREVYRDDYRVMRNDKKTVRDVYVKKEVSYGGSKVKIDTWDDIVVGDRGDVVKVSREYEDYSGRQLSYRDYAKNPISNSSPAPRSGAIIVQDTKTGVVSYASPSVVKAIGADPTGSYISQGMAEDYTGYASGNLNKEQIVQRQAERAANAQFNVNMIEKVQAGTARAGDLIPKQGVQLTPGNIAALRGNVNANSLNALNNAKRNETFVRGGFGNSGDNSRSVVFNSRTDGFSGLGNGRNSDVVAFNWEGTQGTQIQTQVAGGVYGVYSAGVNSSNKGLGIFDNSGDVLLGNTATDSISKEADEIAQDAQGLSARAERTKETFRLIPGLRGDNYVQKSVRYALALPTLATVGFIDTLRVGAKAGFNVYQGFKNPETSAVVGESLAANVKGAPMDLVSGFDPRDPEGFVNLAVLVAPGVPKVVKVERLALDVRAPSSPINSQVTLLPEGVTNVKATTFGLQSGTKAYPIITKLETGGSINGVPQNFATRYVFGDNVPALGNQNILLKSTFQPESALGGKVFNSIVDTGVQGKTRINSLVGTASILQGEKGLPVNEFITKVEGVKNPKRASVLVEEFLKKNEGIIYGSSTTEQLPVGYRTLKPGDIDAIAPKATALELQPQVAELAKQLKSSGEDIAVSKSNPLILEFPKTGEKFIEVKSGLEPGAFGADVAPAGFLGIQFADLKAGQTPKTVPFGAVKAIYAGEQQARKASAASVVSPPNPLSDAPKSFKEVGGVIGKDRASDSRVVKDIAGFVQSTEGLIVLRESQSLKNFVNPYRLLQTARARVKLNEYLGTFTDAQKMELNSYLKSKTGRELIPLSLSDAKALPKGKGASAGSYGLSASAVERLFASPSVGARSPSPSSRSPSTSSRSSSYNNKSPSVSSPYGRTSPFGGSPLPSPSPAQKSPSPYSPKSPSMYASLTQMPSPYASPSPYSSRSPSPYTPKSPSPYTPDFPKLKTPTYAAPKRRRKEMPFRLEEGYDTFVRRFGKFQKIALKPMTKAEAFRLGDRRVRTTAAATFTIRKSNKLIRNYNPNARVSRSQYYTKRKGVDTLFIQRRGKRIGTKGEYRDITRGRKNGLI